MPLWELSCADTLSEEAGPSYESLGFIQKPGLTPGMCQRLDRQRKLSGRSQEMTAGRNAAAAKD